MMNLLTEVDPKTGRKTLSPIYGILRSRRKAEIRKDEPEQKSVTTKCEVITQTPEHKSTITESQRQAVSDLQRYKAGGLIDMRCHTPQTAKTPEPVKALSFEEQIISDWKNNPGIRAEFVSLSSYQAFRKAQEQGKAKIIKDRIAK